VIATGIALFLGARLHDDGSLSIGTLIERHARYLILFHVPEAHTGEAIRDGITSAVNQLPSALRRSLTWDQGKEMAAHAQFSVKTGVPVFFCDPRSPWQRGSNENTNGLLRQYFPKRTEIAHFTQADLDDVAAELNDRPRQTLGWRSPSQALDEVLR